VNQPEENRPFRVVVHGLTNFCKRLPPLLRSADWEIQFHDVDTASSLAALANELRRSDLVYTWGGRITLGKFLWAARALRKSKLIMFWCGSDVLFAQEQFAQGKLEPWVADKVHWAGAPWLAEEVRAMGLRCEYVPTTWVLPSETPLSLPDRFTVLVYLPAIDRTALYGIDQVLYAARALPNIQFVLAGLPGGRLQDSPPNLQYAYWVKDMPALYRRCTVVWRPVRHDGLSFMALEALAHGRHVLWSYPFPGCVHVKSTIAAMAELERLHAMHLAGTLSVNLEGTTLIARDFSPERIRQNILHRWREVILSRPARDSALT
jgi:hypothetical protein